MTKEMESARRNSPKAHANLCNLLMFLTGVSLGCGLIFWGGFQFGIDRFLNSLQSGSELVYRLIDVCIANGKFLILLYLLSYLHLGAMLVPTVFGLEGMLLGSSFSAAFAGFGYPGVTTLGLVLMVRLLLILPYGFLLGTWSVDQSLQGDGGDYHPRTAVLCITLSIVFAASVLECTAAHWLGRMYYGHL